MHLIVAQPFSAPDAVAFSGIMLVVIVLVGGAMAAPRST